MKRKLRAASTVCSFFLFSVAWYTVAPPIIYFASVTLLPLVEEVVKTFSFKQVRWNLRVCVALTILFIILESVFKYVAAHGEFHIPGFNAILTYLLVFSPLALHAFNMALSITMNQRRISFPIIVLTCSAFHYTYNIYRAILPLQLYLLFILDTTILVVATVTMLKSSHAARALG